MTTLAWSGYRAMLAYGVARVIDLRGGIPAEPESSAPVPNDGLVVSVPWIDPVRDRLIRP